MYVEMVLYHALDATGSIEVSTTSSSGPWTKVTLTSPKPITEALAEWQALANAALPAGAWNFHIQPSGTGPRTQINLYGTFGSSWVRLPPCLMGLLGFATSVINASFEHSTLPPLGLITSTSPDSPGGTPNGFAVGVTFPAELDSADLSEYRGARHATHHYGRATEVTVDLFVPAEIWPGFEESPILSGHAAFRVVTTDSAAFSESNFDGSMVVYPLEELIRERDCDDDAAWIRFRCTTATPAAQTSTTRWATLACALPYGYAMYYIERMHGIPTLFLEVEADAIAPAGFTLDATLVIDRSSRLGSLVDGDTAAAKAMDHEMRLLDSSTVRTYFGTRPERYARLTAALTPAATSMDVDNPRAWEGLSEVYIGVDCIPFSSITADGFSGLDRTSFQRPRSYPVGTPVTDGPNQFQGRQVDIYAVDIDPCGNYVQGADVLEMACMFWSGVVADRPVRDGSEWVIEVSDQVRRLVDPIGTAASGTAIWTDDDDALLPVPVEMKYIVKAQLQPTSGTILDVTVRPFAAYASGDQLRASRMRELVVDALVAASTDPQVVGFVWVKHVSEIQLDVNRWDLAIKFNPAAGDTVFQTLVTYCDGGANVFYGMNFLSMDAEALDGAGSGEVRRLWLMQPTRVVGVSLAVDLDDGDATQVPPDGMVMLDAGGRVDYAHYTAVDVDPLDPGLVRLTLDHRERILGREMAEVLQGEREDVSVRFLWADAGALADILRRAIVSSGDAQNGTYDTLPKGQGLSLSMIDEDSFDEVFGSGLFADLDFQIFQDSDSSIAEIFGGIMRLSRTSLVPRRRDDGSGVDITAVDVGSVDTGVPVARLTEDILVVNDGRKPIRVKSVFRVPQQIKAKVRTAPVDDVPAGEGVVPFRDPHLIDWTGHKWDIDVYGLSRDVVRSAGRGWALGIFRSGETQQVIEVDVPLWFDAQPGHVIEVDLPDVSLWDYALGTPGYVGLARVLGDPFSLATGVKVITIACDGISTAGPMCPSLPIFAVGGSDVAPTYIDVEDVHYDLLVAAKDGQSTFSVCCYEPGQDTRGTTHSYTISTVTLPGGGVCRLTVTAYPVSPSRSLVAGHRLTWPVSAACTDNQARYLHTDNDTQWS